MSVQPQTCIIIDDEEDAREFIKHRLERYNHIGILAFCEDTEDAFEAILLHKPDILFLDIQMPQKSGFDLLEDLRKANPYICPTVVFITAYDKYAIKAIKYAAFDYLLKPISKDEFHTTILNIAANKEPLHRKLDKYLQFTHPDNKLRINTRTGYLLINVNDIIYCTADANYTNIILGKNKMEVATMNLGKTTKLLQSNPQFKRIGRSLLINTNYLYKVDRVKKVCVLEKEGSSFKVGLPDKYLGAIQ